MEKLDPKYELIKNKLEEMETSPDPYAWDKIYDALHKKPVYLKLNRFNNLSIAVSLISIFAFSIFFSPKITSPSSELDELNVTHKDSLKHHKLAPHKHKAKNYPKR
ncbi:hypothetical protein [Sporocytophaga myxococcoides]|uniref:hypothetical protein n=1 Tax=Sporocytophaga myxococcoides TaxID=153721 RepID=UPI0003F7A206|nr:hypothetical protein [Sporocytophaga myxococcoides]